MIAVLWWQLERKHIFSSSVGTSCLLRGDSCCLCLSEHRLSWYEDCDPVSPLSPPHWGKRWFLITCNATSSNLCPRHAVTYLPTETWAGRKRVHMCQFLMLSRLFFFFSPVMEIWEGSGKSVRWGTLGLLPCFFPHSRSDICLSGEIWWVCVCK